MGIPEEAIGHVFERFYRVDKARSRATGGSGLGLAIVRTIVQRNRGEISVSSKEGEGTTFTVVFPAFDTEVDPE
jgi:two-component system phosphate regulon sensor histidine kinase PhoR